VTKHFHNWSSFLIPEKELKCWEITANESEKNKVADFIYPFASFFSGIDLFPVFVIYFSEKLLLFCHLTSVYVFQFCSLSI